MLKKIYKNIIITGLMVVTVLISVGCSSNKNNSSDTNKGKISIVTSTNVYANIAKNIVGKYGNSTAIIKNSSADPHDYEATTADAKEISNADIIVANGLGYDTWINKLAKSNKKEDKEIKVGEDLLKLKKDSNPHIWYDLNMPDKYVEYLVNKLSKIDKKHASYYKDNGKEYLKKVDKIKQIANKIDGKNSKPVYVSEPVFDYALEATNFKVGNKEFEEAVEKEVDPSAKVIDSMLKDIKGKKIAFFVNNTQTESSTINNMVKQCHNQNIPVLNVRETIPNNVSYIEWMTKNYNNLAKVAK